jgi:hypothetical protein
VPEADAVVWRSTRCATKELPIMRHTITLLQVQQWLDERTTNPAMQARKQQLKAMMATT